MKPTVSVIIPCYNAEAWIGKQITAVLAQLGPEDELVLVDNLSTDTTPTLLAAAAAADPRVRTVLADQRQGVNHARNTGLAAARGDRIRCLGVTEFGQSSDLTDAYAIHRIDTGAIIDAALGLLGR